MSRVKAVSEGNFSNPLDYYKRRGGVIFISYCRFWERHGFVQQSLAMELVRNGVPVTWVDGAGWRGPSPHVPEPHPLLTVRAMPQLALTRFAWVREWDLRLKTQWVHSLIRRSGQSPVVWIQGGTEEAIVERLPYVDVFSVFDDLYRHSPRGILCQRAKVVVTQTEAAAAYFRPTLGEKVRSLLPPIDFADSVFTPPSELTLPPRFPSIRLGYVGSFFPEGFDFDLLESLIVANPQWGFILQGRTDREGERRLAGWEKYPNFHCFPWVPRQQLASVWSLLSVSLLLYRENPTQEGAFPVKAVESLRFGIPCVATRVAKTAELDGVFPRGATLAEIEEAIRLTLKADRRALDSQYERMRQETNPLRHLTEIRRWCEAT